MKIKINNRPLILVTNDDGVTAKGIDTLINVVKVFGDVVVVAPGRAMSGMSHAITTRIPLYLRTVKKEEGLSVYKSNGSPADCVKIAVNYLLDRKPDFVVSGINHGSNSSVSMHYSGTMGGAREGTLFGIPSIAFSLLDYRADADFSTASYYVGEIFRWVFEHGIAKGVSYNVNIPPGDNLKGIKICRQAKGRWVEQFERRVDPRGRDYFWLTGYYDNHEPDATDTDEWALANNYVSLVPCSVDATDFESVERLKENGLESVPSHIASV
ncbi:5'/3'-nucleotidase SurE [Marinilabiliaceae bacterium ANBcel2]|nr:5'/3'-nucleotidase SurE [Marinilabiliaceae bacterium ANBcel2]